MIGAAFELALKAHQGQTDKAGMAYIGHVARVAAGVETDSERVVALLHDVVEDCDVSLSEIEAKFGAEVAAGVDAMTRRKGEASATYYARVRSNPLALRVKLSDIADNSCPDRMKLLDEATRVRLTKKYSDALAALGAK